MVSMRISSVFLIATTVILVGGCAMDIHRLPPSPYNAYYNGDFSSVTVPETLAIRDAGVSWTFSRSPEDVSDSVLKVVHQYEGVLGFLEGANGEKRILVIHGQPMFFITPPRSKNSGMVVSKFLDDWMALAVIPVDDGKRTVVSVAWVSPKTGAVAPLEAVTSKEAVAGGEKLVDADSKDNSTEGKVLIDANEFRGGTAASLDTIVSSLSDERNRIDTALTKSQNAEVRWQYVPRAMINEFFYHLATQLYGPPRWRDKFLTEPSKRPETAPTQEVESSASLTNSYELIAAQGTPSNVKSNIVDSGTRSRSIAQRGPIDVETIADTEQYQRLVFEAGQWTSASLRRSLAVVDPSPPLSQLLEFTVDRIKTVANQPEFQVTPYIVASPQVNAFAVPNGDVFITSGLLEAVDSEDELAAVLAHELDHLFQHDSMTSLLNRESAIAKAQAIQMGAAILGGLLGGVISAPVVGASGAVSSSLGSQVAGNVVSQTVSSVGQLASQHLGATMITGHSQEAELRADRNGARYLWASGYNVEAFVKILERLKELRVAAEKRKEPVISGFINAQPGLDARIVQTNEVIKAFKDDK